MFEKHVHIPSPDDEDKPDDYDEDDEDKPDDEDEDDKPDDYDEDDEDKLGCSRVLTIIFSDFF